MIDLTTRWMGLDLRSPLVAGAGPMADDLGSAERLAQAGVGAIVVRSLFEEQIAAEELATVQHLEASAESYVEAASYLPDRHDFVLGPDEYLAHVERLKKRVDVPVIASLNGTTRGGWLRYAGLVEQAGADGLELNVYDMPTDPERSAVDLEGETLSMVEEVTSLTRVPVAVKLSPFYTSLPHFAQALVRSGADGLVIFNRFFQPDIDPVELEARRTLRLSDASELPLRLRWLAVLSGRVETTLAVTGGVHRPLDAVKALMAGADAVQMLSALLIHGPEYAGHVLQGVSQWMEEHEYPDLGALVGCMDLTRTPDPHAYERANYVEVLQSWERGLGVGR